MTTYAARLTETEMGIFAMVVRVDADGWEQVDGTFRARHFASLANAQRATAKHLQAIT